MVFRLLGATASLLVSTAVLAQQEAPKVNPQAVESYITPPESVEKAVLAPWQKNSSVTNMTTDGTRWVQVQTEGLPFLANLAEPHINLGGVEIDIKRNCSRTWTERRNMGMVIKSTEGKPDVVVQIPKGVSPLSPEWSPDEKWVAFLGHEDDGVYLYVANAENGKVRRLTSRPLLAILESGIRWKSDSSAIAAVLIPRSRPELPKNPRIPSGPSVRVSDPVTNSIRTFPDRLENADEQQILRHYTTGQAAIIELNGKVTEAGATAMISSFDPAPDFSVHRVTTFAGKFLYIYPVGSFARRTALWDAAGKEIAEISKTDGPDVARAPKPDDRRSMTWDPFGRGLVFLQRTAPDKDNKRKDQIVLWKAPYSKDSTQVLWTSDVDISSYVFLEDKQRALVTQTIAGDTVWNLATLGGGATKVLGFKPGDFYANPGSPVTKDGPVAGGVLRTTLDASGFYLSGAEYNKEPDKVAPRPFLDKVSFADGKKERVWQSSAEKYETLRLLSDDGSRSILSRQSPTEIGNDFLYNVASKAEKALTANVDYLPEVSQLRRERVQITRADGFKFWAEVTLPRYALSGEGRKSFFWFYPNEVRNQSSYDEGLRTRNINQFRRPSANAPHLMALMGYVVVEPDVPIVGPAEKPNDTYVMQLRNSLYAIIDELDRKKLIDRRYLSIGGHSYGAFSTANAMVETPFFKAGIAGSGAYNRTLTPFGFQAEPRKLWEARDVYLDMSPILKADQLTGALLMTHGMEDQNVGTFPINSYRMFDALEALGKTAALYVYPYEDHGQIARETVLDKWARWILWLETHLK